MVLDGPTSRGLHKDLHGTVKAQGGFSLDVVTGERLSIHKLLCFKQEPLLVLNLCLDQIANLVSKLHLEADGLASWDSLHGNLHAATWTEVKVQGRMVDLVKGKLALLIN